MDYKEYERLFDECYERGGFDDCYLRKDSDGNIYYEIYVDYGDIEYFDDLVNNALSKVSDITNIDSIRNSVNSYVYDAYENVESEKAGEVREAFESYLDENDIEYDDDEIRDIIYDLFYCSYESVYGYVYSVNIPIDVTLNGEDLYIEHRVVNGFSEGGEIVEVEGTSFEKFLNMCGHSVEEFEELEATGYDSSKPETFMESVVVDFRNAYFPSLNQITFLGGISLEDLVNKIEGKQPLIVKKDAVCGLWDFNNGAGGLMVELENDLEIPFGEYNITPDSEGGIDNACGFVGEVWRGHIE